MIEIDVLHFKAHIRKNHGGVGSVMHDKSLKPRSVSPPCQQLIAEAEKELVEDNPQASSRLGIQALPHSGGEPVTEAVKHYRRIPAILNRKRYNEGQDLKDSVPFYCPHCNFSSDLQLVIGDHVVIEHMNEHIKRNAQICPN